MPEAIPTSILDQLGAGLLNPDMERAFIDWCVLATVRPAFAHALSTHELLVESRQMMAAESAQTVSRLAERFGERARQTMVRQLALWIQQAMDNPDTRAAWSAAREAAVWSLVYSQRLAGVSHQAEQYQQFDQQIRQTHASKLRDMAEKARQDGKDGRRATGRAPG